MACTVEESAPRPGDMGTAPNNAVKSFGSLATLA